MQGTPLSPGHGYLRISAIVGTPAKGDRPAVPGIIPVSRSHWWQGVKTGLYPQPTRALGKRITAWAAADIFLLLEKAAAAKAP